MSSSIRRSYLTREAALGAVLHAMMQRPSYRPGAYSAGSAGIAEAQEALEDLRALSGGLQSEGDA